MKLNLGCGTDYREGFENGNIWLCKAPCEDKALEFELIDRAFFWLNFASKSLKKVEVGK